MAVVRTLAYLAGIGLLVAAVVAPRPASGAYGSPGAIDGHGYGGPGSYGRQDTSASDVPGRYTP